MKPFSLEPNMLTMRGVFYPTGHMFVMFPTEKDAREAEHALEADGYNGESRKKNCQPMIPPCISSIRSATMLDWRRSMSTCLGT